MIRAVLIAFLLSACVGCASVRSVPSTLEGARFDDPVSGKVGWSRYQGTDSFARLDKETALRAARFVLNRSGFVVQKEDPAVGYVVGKHGLTPYDWNVICGVYVKEMQEGCLVKVIAQGSYDIGFAGDASWRDWVQEVLRYMRQYVGSEQSQE